VVRIRGGEPDVLLRKLSARCLTGVRPRVREIAGEEVLISMSFNTPVLLSTGHYFFRPEAGLSNGDFLWLSAPKPIVSPGTPFTPDLQSWIRNDNLSPDWLRIGTDILIE
jgi:hypothetical protein